MELTNCFPYKNCFLWSRYGIGTVNSLTSFCSVKRDEEVFRQAGRIAVFVGSLRHSTSVVAMEAGGKQANLTLGSHCNPAGILLAAWWSGQLAS